MTDQSDPKGLPVEAYLLGGPWTESNNRLGLKRTLDDVEREEEDGWGKRTRRLSEMTRALAKKRESLQYPDSHSLS
jgi:hypothetical protein